MLSLRAVRSSKDPLVGSSLSFVARKYDTDWFRWFVIPLRPISSDPAGQPAPDVGLAVLKERKEPQRPAVHRLQPASRGLERVNLRLGALGGRAISTI